MNMNAFVRLLLFVGLASQASAQSPAPAGPTPQVDKFVRDIVLCGRQNKTTRWLQRPRLEITSSSATLRGFTEASYASITQAAGLATPGEGVIHVFIGMPREFVQLDIVRRRRLAFVGTEGCMYWQEKDQSLKEAFIFVKDIPDKTEEHKKHALFHNLLASFGLMKNSPIFPDSTFGGNSAFDLQLSPLDVHLLGFFYQHVPPASQSSDVTKLLKLHWLKPAAATPQPLAPSL